MKIILKIDHRESKIKQYFTDNKIDNCDIFFENLLCGDFLFQIFDEDKIVKSMVFERKTLNDLASSIKDTRWRNQKQNLLNNFDRSDIYYIIEGKLTFNESSECYSGIHFNTLISSIVNTMVRDDIKILSTQNILETQHLLEIFAKKLLKDADKLIVRSNSDILQKISKSTHLTKNNFFQNCLHQIPGLSEKTSRPIINKYKCINNFFSTLNEININDKLNELSRLRISSCDGDTEKSRKISKNVIIKIIDYFWGDILADA